MTGKLADPVFRVDRARKARAAQTTPDYYIRQLVDRAPELTESQRSKLAALLRPSATEASAA